MVDPWEAMQKDYQRTVVVLDRFDREINAALGGGVEATDGKRKRVRIALVAGADLIQSMLVPGLWSEPDINHILRHYGAFAVHRAGSNTEEVLASLHIEGHNVHIIEQLVPNEVSSTRIRQLLRQGMSVRYLVPPPVIRYIEEHSLYV
jgi:nicotinamide mononucleotide adenylyltransferase